MYFQYVVLGVQNTLNKSLVMSLQQTKVAQYYCSGVLVKEALPCTYKLIYRQFVFHPVMHIDLFYIHCFIYCIYFTLYFKILDKIVEHVTVLNARVNKTNNCDNKSERFALVCIHKSSIVDEICWLVLSYTIQRQALICNNLFYKYSAP